MEPKRIGLDISKNVFYLHGVDKQGEVVLHTSVSRGQLQQAFSRLPRCIVGLEACGTAHFWGREAGARGHRVVLLPPHAVRPYVLRNKTDGADAKGLLEAARNEAIRPVPVKSVDQHVLASLHRMRSAWMATRTARLNTLRGLLRELGLSIPMGARQVAHFAHREHSDRPS